MSRTLVPRGGMSAAMGDGLLALDPEVALAALWPGARANADFTTTNVRARHPRPWRLLRT